MQIQYYKEYSRFLKCDMEFKVFGHAGVPCLCLPCENGRFYDFEDKGMVSALSHLIDDGRVRLFCADLHHGELADSEQQERWFNYLCLELHPRMLQLCGLNAHANTNVIALGTSLGASHAVALYLRRPALFNAAIGLSGHYRANHWFGQYADDLTLRGFPLDFVQAGKAAGPYQTGRLILGCGEGAYEPPFLAGTQALADVLTGAEIPFALHLWGQNAGHDWPFWQQQARTLLEGLVFTL